MGEEPDRKNSNMAGKFVYFDFITGPVGPQTK